MAKSGATTRLEYEVALRTLQNAVPGRADNARLTQSYIRTEMPIVAGTTQYQIQTIVNQNNTGIIYAPEKRIAMQDWFIASEMFVGLAVATATASVNYFPLTYPDPLVFSAGVTAADALALYNGWLSLTIDNTKVLPEWDIARHYYVPQTQAMTNMFYTTSGISNKNQLDFGENGWYPIAPMLIFNGAANLEFNVNLPAGIATVQANSRIVVMLRGHKAQNVTNVN